MLHRISGRRKKRSAVFSRFLKTPFCDRLQLYHKTGAQSKSFLGLPEKNYERPVSGLFRSRKPPFLPFSKNDHGEGHVFRIPPEKLNSLGAVRSLEKAPNRGN
jgi:hypothetical protein